MKHFVYILIIPVLVFSTLRASAEFSRYSPRLGEVFAACHYRDKENKVISTIHQIFTDTGQVFWSGREAGRVLAASNRFIAFQIIGYRYYASFFIDLESQKYWVSQISNHGGIYKASSFEGECHPIIGTPVSFPWWGDR